MLNEGYRLRYLPTFYEDVQGVMSYIKNKLYNPQAASDLLDDVETAILQRLPVLSWI